MDKSDPFDGITFEGLKAASLAIWNHREKAIDDLLTFRNALPRRKLNKDQQEELDDLSDKVTWLTMVVREFERRCPITFTEQGDG